MRVLSCVINHDSEHQITSIDKFHNLQLQILLINPQIYHGMIHEIVTRG